MLSSLAKIGDQANPWLFLPGISLMESKDADWDMKADAHSARI